VVEGLASAEEQAAAGEETLTEKRAVLADADEKLRREVGRYV
jgi:hypothetical protein